MTHFYFAEIQKCEGIHQNTWLYNVCSIKLETKVVRLHKIGFRRFHCFLLIQCTYAVHDS